MTTTTTSSEIGTHSVQDTMASTSNKAHAVEGNGE